ncbi:MAG: endonuclease/exonuclease/phosphatase family protein [Rectinemataceae bacterium]
MRPSSAASLAAVCFLCLSASRCASPLPSSGSRCVSIVAYNVKSLFDARDDGPEFPEFSVAKGRWDDARYKIRLANVAAAVLAAGPSGGTPDILCLEEIENEKVLEALRAGPLSAARYRYAAIAPAEGGPFSNCVLSRLPILSAVCHAASTPAGRAGRDVLELELDAGGRRLFLLSCHWKSKSGGAEETEEARREDAALVRGRVAARMAADPGVELVVCGDFNESPDEFLRVNRRYATALMPVEEASTKGPSPERLLVASTLSPTSSLQNEIVLYSPWEDSGGYSYSFRGARERLDGFLLSPGLLDAAGLSFTSFAAANAPFLMDAEGAPLAWPGSGATGYSDHLPVFLMLELKK